MSESGKKAPSDRGEGELIAMVEHKGEDIRTIFDRYDTDHDGSIPLVEFHDLLLKTNITHEVPEYVLKEISRRADVNRNGKLEYGEFVQLYTSPELSTKARRAIRIAHNYATKLVVPRNKRLDELDASYNEQYNCWPPPITIFIVTILEVAVFFYYVVTLGNVSASGPIPFKSVLIYDPRRRYEAWRYVTYMLIHAGAVHIFFNILIQLLLGIPLEMVHKYWRVWLVYMSGVLAGSLGTSISDPHVFLAGASGGVYALITGHLATIIMNFQEMEYAIFQLIGFLLLMIVDSGIAIYNRYLSDQPDKTTGYAAHLAGAIAGLLVGIVALRNLEQRKWEKPLWWISLVLVIVFLLTMIIWNAAFPSYFYPSKWD